MTPEQLAAMARFFAKQNKTDDTVRITPRYVGAKHAAPVPLGNVKVTNTPTAQDEYARRSDMLARRQATIDKERAAETIALLRRAEAQRLENKKRAELDARNAQAAMLRRAKEEAERKRAQRADEERRRQLLLRQQAAKKAQQRAALAASSRRR